jgi:hypothetical protein
MVTLTSPHKELYDAMQETARRSIQRASGTEVPDLADNETLARDIGAMSLESVAELLKRHSSPGRVW